MPGLADPSDGGFSDLDLHREIDRLGRELDETPQGTPEHESIRNALAELDGERARRRHDVLQRSAALAGAREGRGPHPAPYGERIGPSGEFILYQPTLEELARLAREAEERWRDAPGPRERPPLKAEAWPEDLEAAEDEPLFDDDAEAEDTSPLWVWDVGDDVEEAPAADEEGDEYAEDEGGEEVEDPALVNRRTERRLALERLHRERGLVFTPPEGDLADNDVFDREMEKVGWVRTSDGDWVEVPPPPPPPAPKDWGAVDTPTKLIEAVEAVVTGGKLDDRVAEHLAALIDPENVKSFLKMIAFFALLQAFGLPTWAVAAVGFGVLVVMFGADFIELGAALIDVSNARTQAEFDAAVERLTDAVAKLGVDFFVTLVTLGFSRYVARRLPGTAIARSRPSLGEPRVPIKATVNGRPVQAWLEYPARGATPRPARPTVPPSRRLPGPPGPGGMNQPRRWSGPLPGTQAAPGRVPGRPSRPPMRELTVRPAPKLIGMHPPGQPVYYLPKRGWWVSSVRITRATKTVARNLYRAIFGESIPRGYQLRHAIAKRLLAGVIATFDRPTLISFIRTQLPELRAWIRSWGGRRWGSTKWGKIDPAKLEIMPHEQLARLALELLYNDVRYMWAGPGGPNMWLGRLIRGGKNLWANWDMPKDFDELRRFLMTLMALSAKPPRGVPGRPRGPRPPRRRRARPGPSSSQGATLAKPGRRRDPGSGALPPK